jgi:hypothetical protein
MSRQQDETFGTIECNDVVHSALILDLNGPFILHVKKNMVSIHAPDCPEHVGNFLTDTNDISLSGPGDKGWVYELSFRSNEGGICYSNPEHMLQITYHMDGISPSDCNFVFTAPRPDAIMGLHREPIWIHQRNAKRFADDQVAKCSPIIEDKRARGLRLIYRHCYSDPQIKNIAFPKDGTELNFDVDFWTKGLNPAYRSMSLRFAANHATSDEHHQDAYKCFQIARALVSQSDRKWDMHQWRVDFDTSILVPGIGEAQPRIVDTSGKHPHDCGALAIVIKDE